MKKQALIISICLFVDLFFSVPVLTIAQDSDEGFFEDRNLEKGFFDENTNSEDDAGYEIEIPPNKTQKPSANKSAPSPELPNLSQETDVKSQASGIIGRVKSIIDQGSGSSKASTQRSIDSARSAQTVPNIAANVAPNIAIEKSTLASEASKAQESLAASQEVEEPVDVQIGLNDFFQDAKGFTKKGKPVLSLIVSVSPKNHFLKHVEALYRVQRNKKVQLGEVMLVFGSTEELKEIQQDLDKLNDLYDYPYLSFSYAGKVPERYVAQSSPIWIASLENTDHVYEVGELSPLELFDEHGNLLVPNESK